MNNENEPALASASSGDHNWQIELGITKREYFAAMAMQGILANPNSYEISEKTVAEAAVINADVLLKELEETEENGDSK